jgi:cephalosporin hydroxylase
MVGFEFKSRLSPILGFGIVFALFPHQFAVSSLMKRDLHKKREFIQKETKEEQGMSTRETTVIQEQNVITPLDERIAEAICETKPHWVIEVGYRNPVSILYHGYLLSRLGDAHTLVSITRNLREMPQRKNIYYIDETLGFDMRGHLEKRISPRERVMVILGDAADGLNPLTAIQKYAPLVTKGCYLVMDEMIGGFAMKHVEFDPDWTIRGAQIYLKEVPREWSCRSLSPSFDQERELSAVLQI